MTSQYPIPRVSADWASSRETHPAVAVAIYAISDSSRSPEAIWEAPTNDEWDHVAMAVENYVANDVFEAEDDGRYPWGGECIVIEGEKSKARE
jgi:hypothetical protein